jgi:DNA replication protein DnaC
LSPEEFQKEADSPYATKRYHYNHKHPEELTEECMRRTFVNMATNAIFSAKDKTVREENLNFDSMTSRERDEVMYRMNRQLEEIAMTPDAKESFFTQLT